LVIAFNDPGTVPVFLHQVGGRHEEVHQHPPFGGVKGGELFSELLPVKAVISQVLAHYRPVLFFNMGIIVFLIRS